MTPLWAVGLLCAALLAASGLWVWLALSRPRVRPAVYRHGGWWYREWRRPYVTVVRPAERRYGLVLNRYVDHVVIGVALYVGNRGLSLVWARPRFDRDPTFDDWTDQALAIANHTEAAMRRIANHTEAAMRRVEHTVPWPHLSAEEAADCTLCSPSSLPRRIEEGT